MILVKFTESNEELAFAPFKRIATVLDLLPLREAILYFFQGMKEKGRRDRMKMREQLEDQNIEEEAKKNIFDKDKETRLLLARMRLVKKLFKEHSADPLEELM